MMRTRTQATVVLLAIVLVGAACSSNSNGSATAPSATLAPAATAPLKVTYGAQPTVSAKMVCAADAQTAIGAALNNAPTQVSTPTWVDHLYSCNYVYSNGSFTLSVKELPTIAQTVSYFSALQHKLGVKNPLALGQEGFVAPNADAVVRKDNKVLLVDVARLPSTFGEPPQPRNVASGDIAIAILGCWTGD